MNILVTGMNPADSNEVKRVPRVAIFQAFVEEMKFLESRGHTLLWKRMLVGDQIPAGVEAVVVSSMLPRSLNCRYAFGVIWTMMEALRLEIPLVIHMTDWAFANAFYEFKSIGKAGTPYFQKQIGGALQYNEPPGAIEKHGEAIIEFCQQWGNPTSLVWNRAEIAVPRFTYWGDVRIVQKLLPGVNKVHTWDPTPLFLKYLFDEETYLVKPLAERKKRWILPSLLTDHRWVDSQDIQWPVNRFGPKGYIVLDDEREVHRAYLRRVGALCPPYPHSGSGWWRSRWIHSAFAGNVLLCDYSDASEVGPVAYRYTGYEYEHMTPENLQLTADNQRSIMNDLLQRDEEVLYVQLTDALEEAGA